MKIKKGFSLLELTLVLGVGAMVAFMKFQDMKNEQEMVIAKAVGQQMKQMGEAVNGYINIRYDKLSTLTSSSSQSSDPGPRTCDSSGCEITYQTLINEGLLPASYTGINANHSPYQIILKRDGVSPNYVINGLITTSDGWSEGGKTRFDLLGKAMQTGGIDSGMTITSSIASGYNGQWSEKSSEFSNITSIGQLALRVGFNSALYSVYLRRDGTLPMTGDLNMGGKNINNVSNLNATGNIITTGDISGRNVIAHNGYGSSLTIGGDAEGNDFEVKLSGQKQINFLSDDGSAIALATNGRLEVRDPQTGLVGVNINYDGSIDSIGSITASGNITSSQIVTGQYLKASQVIVAGTVCNDNGLLARDNAGQIFSCINGKWQLIGDQPGTIKMWGAITPPDEWLELNGQYFDKVKNPILASFYPSGKLPDFRGQFVRAWDHGAGVDSDSTRGILSIQGDAMRNIVGNIYGIAHYVNSGGNGVFSESRSPYWTDIKAGPANTTGSSSTYNANIDASRQVPTAPENRPKNITVMYIIKQG
ncbi:TPA: shufflon system plasmid conjugative transfer pilus tip adhesin PilV [Klebsiella pneumoniae]|uniref:shufflon system plasmid conjugative transfer pilus tip adhesin PilV n=1 Tax=Klebsiella pneumoniae TaxID=573 RepID=UPI002814B468|nr:shufflon system plasmid conjugative transfer pilus tip adhesin PilV [Klebsiella pneumoniae]